MANSNKIPCAVCETPSNLVCQACKQVAYCSKDHQRQHWKKHKKQCCPLKVVYSEQLGRYMVATRDVAEGEILFKEQPLVAGPNGLNGIWPVCLSCFKAAQEPSFCKMCQWPLCSVKCRKDTRHSEYECKILTAKKIPPFSPNEVYKYEWITVLRAVLQKPVVWEQIMKLQSHEKLQKADKALIDFIQLQCDLPNISSEAVKHVVGAIGTNAFNSDDGLAMLPHFRHGTYLYYKASMPSHSCVSNSAWFVQENSDFVLRASVPIKLGDKITILYAEPTIPTEARQKKLSDTKCFTCTCERCLDPTELNTNFSTIKCSKECRGNVVPNFNEGVDIQTWNCSTCKRVYSKQDVESVILKIDESLGEIGEEDSYENVQKMTATLKRFSGVLVHENHYKMHDLENDIVQRVSYLLSSGVKCPVQQLISLSRKCLKMADTIWPGMNRHRGRLLYFLQQGLGLTLLQNPHQENAKVMFEQLLIYRKKAADIFSLEPAGKEEAYLFQKLSGDCEELRLLRSLLISQSAKTPKT